MELVNAGANVFLQSQFGSSPLHFAAARGLHNLATMLLDRGVSVDVADNRTLTPLHRAAEFTANTEVAKILISRGANVKRIGNKAHGALYYAAKLGHVELIRLLVGAGAPLSSRTCSLPFHSPSSHKLLFSGQLDPISCGM